MRENVDRIYESGVFNLIRYNEEVPIYDSGSFFSPPFHIGEELAYESYKLLCKEGRLDAVESISIWNNNADQTNYLGEFTNVIHLEILNSQCKSPVWISKLTNLKRLSIVSTPVEDAIWLKEIKGLQYLVLHDCPISDLSVIRELEEILTLKLVDVDICDIEFIENLCHILYFQLVGCPIDDYSPLLRMNPLDYLEIDQKAVEALGMENIIKHHPNAVIKVQTIIENRKV